MKDITGIKVTTVYIFPKMIIKEEIELFCN